MKKSTDLATPNVPVRPNHDLPPSVLRQPPEFPNSPNPAGGYVPPDRLTSK